tara:strand:+ start:2525 stop:4432 length:1908 start_codon:yes stop_codon:yes gene_type:complete
MKIALGQIEVFPGDCEANVVQILNFINQSKEQGVDLLSISELCIGGYLSGDRFRDLDFCRELMRWNEVIRKASKGISVAFGNVFVDETKVNKDGRFRLYNAAYIYTDGKIPKRLNIHNTYPPGITFKTNLPCYRIYDETRYFFNVPDLCMEEGHSPSYYYNPFRIPMKNGKSIWVGFELCEDLWCNDYIYRPTGVFFDIGESRRLSPAQHLVHVTHNQAKVIINLSASPWTYGKNAARDRRVKELELGVLYCYVNCTGVQNNKNVVTFDGGSTVYGTDGQPRIFSKKPYQPELIIFDTDEELRAPPKIRKTGNKIAEKHDAIIQGIRKFIKKMPIIIGLSGGIDSALCACLCVQALGKERVHLYNLPTEYNKEDTKKSAAKVAKNLDIPLISIPIGNIIDAVEEAICDDENDIPTDSGYLAKETHANLQARIRGSGILATIAQMYKGVFINCGNKVELALNYFTLYGDGGGALSVISDLTKTEVYEMGRYINEQAETELIPEETFELTPSAELEEDQKDPIIVGYHCNLVEAMMNYQKVTPETILQWYLDGELEEKLKTEWEFESPEKFLEDFLWFCKLFYTPFKRFQSPPGIILSKTAFGSDYQETIQTPFEWSEDARRIIRKILAKERQLIPV